MSGQTVYQIVLDVIPKMLLTDYSEALTASLIDAANLARTQ